MVDDSVTDGRRRVVEDCMPRIRGLCVVQSTPLYTTD